MQIFSASQLYKMTYLLAWRDFGYNTILLYGTTLLAILIVLSYIFQSKNNEENRISGKDALGAVALAYGVLWYMYFFEYELYDQLNQIYYYQLLMKQ